MDPGQELSSIDFESMIGGPLIAVVNAQAQAAISTVNFIKTVGFKAGSSNNPEEPNTGDPIYVTFKYYKVLPPAEGESEPTKNEMEIKVPILTMLPIPYIRIDETTIDFNAKINTIEYRKVDTSLNVDASLEAKAGWFFGSAKLKVSASYQRNSQQGNEVTKTYSMAVHVKAVQDEIPGGMEKILDILEGAIMAQPVQKAST